MGSFHCIPSDCARVIVRQYLPPVVRWRYGDKDWQEIEGDDYKIDSNLGQCENVRYRVDIKFNYLNNSEPTEAYRNLYGPIDGIGAEEFRTGWRLCIYAANPRGQRGKCFSVSFANGSGNPFSNEEITSIQTLDNVVDNCGDSTFTVYKNGQTVHQETRDQDPEVEQLPCRLSDVSQEIKIDKTPWLSSIEVIDFGRDADKTPRNPFPLPIPVAIPSECWNIYRRELLDPLPSGNPNNKNEPVFGDYITQICSAPGCPRPEYQVICDCDDEKCPEGTCAIECGDRICCYGSDGIAVKSIPLKG